jgi:hypothetical protein
MRERGEKESKFDRDISHAVLFFLSSVHMCERDEETDEHEE